jgi:hypothetical protein
MNETFQTTWPFFLLLLAGYIALSLFLGAKGVYFEPYVEKEEEKKAESAPTP